MSETTRPGWRQRIESTDLYRSIVRTPPVDSPRGRAQRAFGNVFLHLYPVRVPRAILRFRSTFRLGYISTVLFVILLVTGTYLMFFYTPAVSMAYGDMERLKTQVGFGQLIRNVHRWGAHLMVLTVVLHLVRVFWDGAYKAPRQFNWVVGVGLLVITLAYSFTGYLLPWDQLAYWAVTVGSDLVHYVPFIGGWLRDLLLGGSNIGQAALLRFYVLHIAVLTVFFGILFSVHIWRVRKDGFAPGTTRGTPENVAARGLVAAHVPSLGAPPATPTNAGVARIRMLGVVAEAGDAAHPRSPDDEVFTWPHLLIRHQVTALATMVVVIAMGIAFDAPLREHANPNLTPEPAKAPWYFVGIQELLAHFDPLVAGVLAPAAVGLLLAALPYIDRDDTYRPSERKVIVSLVMLAGLVAFALTVIGAFFRGPGWAFVLPWEHLYFEP